MVTFAVSSSPKQIAVQIRRYAIISRLDIASVKASKEKGRRLTRWAARRISRFISCSAAMVSTPTKMSRCYRSPATRDARFAALIGCSVGDQRRVSGKLLKLRSHGARSGGRRMDFRGNVLEQKKNHRQAATGRRLDICRKSPALISGRRPASRVRQLVILEEISGGKAEHVLSLFAVVTAPVSLQICAQRHIGKILLSQLYSRNGHDRIWSANVERLMI